jgi:hypothetical protein
MHDSIKYVSINTIKYLNGPYNGCIGPQISHWVLSENFSGSVCILICECIKINFPVTHAVHIKFVCLRNFASLKL